MFLSRPFCPLFYRTRLWTEAEAGRDPSGFDQVKIIFAFYGCLLFLLPQKESRGKNYSSCLNVNFTLPPESFSTVSPNGFCKQLQIPRCYLYCLIFAEWCLRNTVLVDIFNLLWSRYEIKRKRQHLKS